MEGHSNNIEKLKELCSNLKAEEVLHKSEEWLKVCLIPPTVDEQILLIVRAIEISKEQREMFIRICTLLEDLANTHFRDTEAVARPFGSSTTYVALKDSDIDIFLDFNPMPMPLQLLMPRLRRILANQRDFYRVLLIKAKVPILKCWHKSGCNFDISFSGQLSLANSKLMRFYVSLDCRIRPLVLLLKFWMKKKNLLGPNHFTSYAVTLLILYYLQQLEVPMVQSVYSLQQHSSPELVSDWNVAFEDDESKLAPNTNTQSVFELIKGFFEFLITFEFQSFVISIYTGDKHLKTELSNLDLVPSVFSLYKENVEKNGCTYQLDAKKPICVQDPFNHSHNVTRNTSEWSLRQLEQHARQALQICKQEAVNMKNKDYKPVFFEKLFSFKDKEKRKRSKGGDCITINMPTRGDGKADTNDDTLLWKNKCIDTLVDVLTKIAGMELQQQSIEDDCTTKLLWTMDYPAVMSKQRNSARKQFVFPTATSIFDKEQRLTKEMVEKVLCNTAKAGLQVPLVCHLGKNPTKMNIKVEVKETDAGQKKQVTDTFRFMSGMVSTMVTKLLTPTSQPEAVEEGNEGKQANTKKSKTENTTSKESRGK